MSNRITKAYLEINNITIHLFIDCIHRELCLDIGDIQFQLMDFPVGTDFSESLCLNKDQWTDLRDGIDQGLKWLKPIEKTEN